MSLITCENLVLSYFNTDVINNLSFSVSDGDYVCILGKNGVGKSTLTKGLLGLIKPKSGKIEFDKSINKNDIGYLPQQTEIQNDFPASVKEVILSGCLNKSGLFSFYTRYHKGLLKKNMHILGISDLEKKSFNELSGGQKQRVLLARALCSTGKLLILDEPSAGLDPVITSEFYELIEHLNKEHKITIIMVSHDISGILKSATHILHLENNDYLFATKDEYINSEFYKRFL